MYYLYEMKDKDRYKKVFSSLYLEECNEIALYRSEKNKDFEYGIFKDTGSYPEIYICGYMNGKQYPDWSN